MRGMRRQEERQPTAATMNNKSNRNNSSNASISHMLHRIEDSSASSTFDPQAMLNLLEQNDNDTEVEDDNSSRWGDLTSCSNGDNDIDNSTRSDDISLHKRSFAQRNSNFIDMPMDNRRMASVSLSAQSVDSFTSNMSQRQESTMTMMTHSINHHARSNPFTASASSASASSAVALSSLAASAFSVTLPSAINCTNHWKRRSSGDGFVNGPDQNNRYWQLTTGGSRQRTLVTLVAVTGLLILAGCYNYSLVMFQQQQQQHQQQHHQQQQYSTNESEMITKNEQGGLFSSYNNNNNNNNNTTNSNNNNDNVPFVMCDRITPYQHCSNTASDRSQYQHITEQYKFLSTNGQWPKSNKILLLRNDGKFGHIGNQFNSLLHAFDYARDHELHIGMLFHSWAMDVIHSMFYESADFDILSVEMEEDFGILLVRDQSQLLLYDEVISQNAQQLYFYKSSNKNADSWRDTMGAHKSILQQLFHRYNRGYGYVHNGLRAKDVCSTLDMFFKDQLSTIKYSVIHAQYMDGNTVWKLEQIAKTTGITIKGGAGTMSPAYVKSILKPLGMLEHPIILLTDGQLPGIERALLNDAIIGPRLMVLSDRVALDGADITLAVLSDVFIGNPASVTSGFIARIRMALGYSDMSTQLFRRKRIHQWYSVCNEDCVFNPWILSKWV
jgi:hypothetical protein